jgi:hypothetical protein
VGEGGEDIPEFSAGNGVYACGGLVEQEDVGFGDEGAAKG